MIRQQSGFTLIELIMVIVILGALAVVALPQYVDLQNEADAAAYEGVFGAAEAAAAINFTHNLADQSGNNAPAQSNAACSNDVINSGACLMGALDGVPNGWIVGASGDGNISGSGGICRDEDNSGACDAGEPAIEVTTVEDGDSRAVLSRVDAPDPTS